MQPDDCTYRAYVEILRRQLVAAQGCTEPISVAWGGALARERLGAMPESIAIRCSNNIIKNVKSVVVPNTNGLRGVDVAAVIGAVAGVAAKKLEVLSGVGAADIEQARAYLAQGICRVDKLASTANLHFVLTATANGHTVEIEIIDEHTNVIRIEHDGEVVFRKERDAAAHDEPDYDCLTVRDILDFADTVHLPDVADPIGRQIDCNTRIAREGLSGDYGVSVGKTLLAACGDGVTVRAKANAAAGSDARMSGCELPVVINSGSGNQGLAVSLPVIEYAREIGAGQDRLYRALVVSSLVAIHQKSKIGWLSAFCGAVTAACGSGAAITYLSGGSYEDISHTIVNILGNVSGMICDGAKPSCAAKIASAVDAAFMGHYLARSQRFFPAGDGIVKGDLEKTIQAVGTLGHKGMSQTDEEVLQIMLDND